MKITAQWFCSLDAECPFCQHEFNVLDLPDASDMIYGCSPCESDKMVALTCPECVCHFEAITTY